MGFFPTSCYSMFHKLIALCKEAFSSECSKCALLSFTRSFICFGVGTGVSCLWLQSWLAGGFAPLQGCWIDSPPLLGLGPTISWEVITRLSCCSLFFMAGGGGKQVEISWRWRSVLKVMPSEARTCQACKEPRSTKLRSPAGPSMNSSWN